MTGYRLVTARCTSGREPSTRPQPAVHAPIVRGRLTAPQRRRAMRAIPLSELRPGAVLAGPVRSPRGLILLQPNVVVTERHIDLMHRHGLELVVAEDVPDV